LDGKKKSNFYKIIGLENFDVNLLKQNELLEGKIMSKIADAFKYSHIPDYFKVGRLIP
jgi:hypothetical protein